MRILLVEDDPEIGIMLKDYLETENFEVVMAHDGGEACDKFAASRFDLVLLDLMIPVVSGMDVLAWAWSGRLYHQAFFRCRSTGKSKGEYPQIYTV